jgi:deoxyribodipyrimidine photolyase-related protein
MEFATRIAAARPNADELRSRKWVYVPYDQLTTAVGPLAPATPDQVGLVFVESRDKARRRAYHKKKLAFVLANERHFALEQAARGFRVVYLAGDAPFGEQLRRAVRERGIGSLTVARPAERELRKELERAVHDGLPLDVVPNETWLTSARDFEACFPGPPYRMDRFYRHVRKRLGVLMDGEKPRGGRMSFDAENRQRYRGEPPPPPAFRVRPDAITREVIDLVERRFGDHFGALDGFDLPTTAEAAARAWEHAKTHALPMFGPFQDAIAIEHPDLFHSRVSPLLNVSRLLPRDVVSDCEALHRQGLVPLASAEGFIRQVLGWREFVRHVHEATDGFRALEPSGAPNALGAKERLPPVYWGNVKSGMECLDHVIDHVVQTGFSHHITRLMVLSNIATLLGYEPRALADWFWFAYVDAYDWVVEPNVLGMGTYADGGVMTTKPYVSGAAYIAKMSDACSRCRFDPTGRDETRPCPLTPLYWEFLARNREPLAANERMRLPLVAASRRGEVEREHAAEVRARVLAHLERGEELPPTVASPRAADASRPRPRTAARPRSKGAS